MTTVNLALAVKRLYPMHNRQTLYLPEPDAVDVVDYVQSYLPGYSQYVDRLYVFNTERGRKEPMTFNYPRQAMHIDSLF